MRNTIVPILPRPARAGRTWLIVCLAVLAAMHALPARATVETVQRWAPMPVSPPAARGGASWIADVPHNRLVLFGGQLLAGNQIVPLNDIWRFDLTTRTWEPLPTTGTLPPARYRHTAIHDGPRHRMLVYGGLGASGYLGDTWSLDLDTGAWTQLTTTGLVPVARARHNAVYDPLRDRMVVFGGNEGSVMSDTLHALNLASLAWSRLTPKLGAPSPRQAAGMTYNSRADRLVLFGGQDTAGVQSDAWVFGFSDSIWSKLNPTGLYPSARYDVSATYDSLNNQALFFGGSDLTTSYNDVVTLSFSPSMVWGKLLLDGSAPSPRGQAAVLPSLLGNRLWLSGGQAVDGTYFSNTYSLSLPNSLWEAVPDSGNPPPVRMACMAIDDAAHDRMVFFGGWTGLEQSSFNETWVMNYGPVDRAALTWQKIATNGYTPGRYGANEFYDPDYGPDHSQRMLILGGGRNDADFTDDFWQLDLNNWTWSELPTTNRPSVRTGQAAVLDKDRNRIVMFGGLGDQSLRKNDTWVLDLATLAWTEVNTAPGAARPAPRLRMAHSHDPMRNRMIIACGMDTLPFVHSENTRMFNDSWALDYDTFTWTQLPTTNDPAPRFDVLGEVIEDQDRMYMFGGAVQDVVGDSNELYSLDLTTYAWSLEVPEGTPAAKRNGYTMVWNDARRWLIPFSGTDGFVLLNNGGIMYQSLAGGPNTPVGPPPLEPPTVPSSPRPGIGLRAWSGGVDFALRSPHGGVATLALFAATGRQVWSASLGLRPDTPASVRWDARGAGGDPAPAGVYLARLITGDGAVTRKLVWMR